MAAETAVFHALFLAPVVFLFGAAAGEEVLFHLPFWWLICSSHATTT